MTWPELVNNMENMRALGRKDLPTIRWRIKRHNRRLRRAYGY